MSWWEALILVIFAGTSAAVARPPENLKIYISADMEGIAGVVTGDQRGPQGFEYQRFREFMTNEVLAAIEGALAAGATESIREKAKLAVARAAGRKPYRLKVPVELELRFKNYRPAEMLAYLPIVERVDAHGVRFRGKDILEVARFIEFVLNCEPGLAP
jgi:D-aminopeptidase